MSGNLPDVNLRARNLRENGILGRSSKDPEAPQIEVVHAAALVLATMGYQVQSRATSTARELWNLPSTSITPQHINQQGLSTRGKEIPFSDDLTFGQRVAAFIEQAASTRIENTRSSDAPFEYLIVWRDRRLSAGIQYNDRLVMYGNSIETSLGRRKPVISNQSMIPLFGVRRLGELVMQSRAEAARRGTTIPVRDAYEALGQPIPGELVDSPPETETVAIDPWPGIDATALAISPKDTD